MPKVMIVDDSPTARALLSAILEGEPDFEVVGAATNGADAIELARRLHPDVITMDISMPGMDGLEATREIMIETPTPIVVVSASTRATEVETSMKLLDAGALTVLQKPIGPYVAEYESLAKEIRDTIRTMAGVIVVRRRRQRGPGIRSADFQSDVDSNDPETNPGQDASAQRPTTSSVERRTVAIGIVSSTGGPPALVGVLSALPSDFPIPILLVQHIVAGFLDGFAQWLDAVVDVRVTTARHGELLQPGTVYVAPCDAHLGVTTGQRIKLEESPPIGGFRPAGSHLLESLARSFGERCVGVIMTGMGRDGVDGLVAIKRAGGHTLAQDESTSVVFGMPRAAIERQAVDRVLPLDAIGPHLLRLAQGPTS